MKRVIKSLSKIIPDKLYLSLVYFKHFGHFPNFRNPQTFNEKIQWLKLYDRNPDYTKMVDKYAVKQYIAETIGSQYVIPTLGVWDRFEDIDFDKLPNRFVLKCTHDSHSVIICKDKSKLNIESARIKLTNGLKRNFYYYGREWPYKNVQPKIIAEKYMGDNLTDYKVLCFEGTPQLIEVHKDRGTDKYTQTFYTIEWKKSNITQLNCSSETIPKPLMLEKMIELSKLLSKGIHHIRIDWYEISGNLYLGELTLFDGSGFVPFDKLEYDEYLGSLIKLPIKD